MFSTKTLPETTERVTSFKTTNSIEFATKPTTEVVTTEKLNDVQKNLLDNLELISELVVQVHQLEVLADRVKNKSNNRINSEENEIEDYK